MPRLLFCLAPPLAAALAFAPVPAAAESFDEHAHQTFEVGDGARLQLVSGDGDVTIVVWDQPRISIDVVYRADWKNVALQADRTGPRFTLEQDGDLVRAIGEEPGAGVTVGFTSLSVHEYQWEIRVPARCALDVRGEDGDIRVGGTEGELRIRAEDGDVELADVVSVEAHVRLDDGSVKATDCAGNWAFRVEDGDVDIRGHRAGPLDIRSEDGSVDLRLEPGDRLDCEIESEDGDVEVVLRAGVGAEVRVRTDGGRVRVPDSFETDEDRERASGRIGDGSGRIAVTTEDGSVTIRSESGAG
jgi:hypothetical protein